MSNLPRGKNAAYWEGFNSAQQRPVALDSADVAERVARSMRRDSAEKQRILTRSPWLFSVMDAQEIAEASGRELAARELKELGITPDSRSVEEQLLDAHHQGRAFARGERIPGKTPVGSASDSAPNAISEFFASLERGE